MTLELHVVEFRGKDNLSPVMKGMSSEAKRSGESLKRMWDEPVQSSRRMEASVAAVGAALGGATLLAGRFGTAYTAQAREIESIRRSYGDSADEILRMTEAIQKNTNYSNDAARQSAIYSSSLIQNYQLTAEQISAVIARSADLAVANVDAQGAQIGLTDAVSRASAAIRGEAEAGELLGLSMSDTFLKTEAARRGMQGWSTTMTEAEKAQFRYTILMEQSAYAIGAASEQAEGARGTVIDLKDGFQDAGAAAGKFLGPIGEVASELGSLALILPGITTGFSLASSALGGIGLTSALTGAGAALTPLLAGALAFAPALAVIGYTAYTAKDHIEEVTEQTNLLADALARVNAEAVAAGTAVGGYGDTPGVDEEAERIYGLTKGSYNVEYTAENGKTYTLESVQAELASLQGAYQDAFLDIARSMDIKFANPAADDIAMLIEQILYFSQLQGAALQDSMELRRGLGLSLIETPKPFNPMEVSRYYGDVDTGYTGPGATPYYLNGMPATPANQIMQPGKPYYGDIQSSQYQGPYQDNTSNRTVMIDLPQQQLVQPRPMADSATYSKDAIEAQTLAIREQYGAYADLVLGINSVSAAQSAYKATQDGLIGSQEVYSAQASEYNSQLSAMEAAHQILNERQAEGQKLTADQIEFQNNYARATEIGTGAVEDAVLAQGMLGQEYLLNKELMDQYKAGQEETNSTTGELTFVIRELIEALGGVPTEVRTRIELDGAAAMHAALDAAVQHLNNIDGQTATFYINTQQTGVSVGNPNGPSIDAGEGYRHGGMIEYAAHGRMMAGNYTLVGDGGMPELITGGQGRMVIPGGATRAMMRGQSGGGITLHNPIINVYANDPMQFQQQLRSNSIMEARA